MAFDPKEASCAIYEIKHSTKAVLVQYRHLVDKEKCQAVVCRFGPIIGKYVIYCSPDLVLENGVEYRNVESYLKTLNE